MDSKQCERCGETVDAAKAFCPGCGNPFVQEEVRTKVSEFDASAGTVQFGNTVYNQLLSDMGLNIAEAPAAASRPGDPRPPQESAPPSPDRPAAAPETGSRRKMIILVIVAGVLLGLAAAAILALAVAYYFMTRPQL